MKEMPTGTGYLKLIDFGIAKKLEEGKTRTFTMRLGWVFWS